MIIEKTKSKHYYWGNNCEGWRLVDGNSLSVIDEEMPPHTSEKIHFHKNAQQLFYIKSGIADFEVEGKIYKVISDQSFYIEPLLKHKIINNTNESLKFIVISQPSTKTDRVETE
jgi:mannose-6-phosphate isomerase-like protein (cupin superfamily)